ncbi:MAG: ribosome assembly cofactor RimP [Chitinophagaceae bacterium]
MNTEQQIKALEGLLGQVLEEEPEYFPIEIKIKPTHNIKVFIDGDNGVTIEKCVRINRKMNKLIEENGLYPEGDFSLEVSSPGIGEALKLHRQYHKNIGRSVEVVLADDRVMEGLLKEVSEAAIVVETTTGKNKKKEVVQHTIPFDQIKTTKVQVTF